MMKLKAGDKAPEFTALNQAGKEVSLHGFRGKKLVLYFYSQANSQTCTIESCNLSDNYKILQKAGFNVLGVSPDSLKKQTNFQKKYKFPFDLIADTDHKVIDAYGLWAEKNLFGHTHFGVLRTTFLIDENGIITEVIDKVKSGQHTDQILNKK
jgi:peroxiredoxin Q/BCP